MKVIKIADKSDYGWAIVQECLSDEHSIPSSERRAERKVKESKKKRVRDIFQPYPGYDSR